MTCIFTKLTFYYSFFDAGGCPCCVMVKVLDCGIVVSKFEFQSYYHVHFWSNTLQKGMNHLIYLAMA